MGFMHWLRTRRQRKAAMREGREHWRQHNYQKSIECYELALQLDMETKGTDHPHVAEDYDNIGVAYKGMGDFDRAAECLKKAIAILESVSSNHILLPAPYNHLGIVYTELGDYDRAVECHERALAIQRKAAGPFAGAVTRTTEVLLGAARAKQRGQRHE